MHHEAPYLISVFTDSPLSKGIRLPCNTLSLLLPLVTSLPLRLAKRQHTRRVRATLLGVNHL